MASVVQSGGTAAGAGLPSGTFGKTGTAEFGNGNPPPTHAWFIGYRGNIAFAVIVEGGGVGGRVAAPLAAQASSNALPRAEPRYFMLSGIRADGSIWPVKRPALKPASASNCVPVTYDAPRAVEEHQRPRLLVGTRVAAPQRLREVRP